MTDTATIKQKRREQKILQEDLPLSLSDDTLTSIARSLAAQIDEEEFRKKYAPVIAVLKLVGAGVFLAASVAAPNLPRAVGPFLSDRKRYEAWKRFNIPYLKRTLTRLDQQKLIAIKERGGMQSVEITQRGKRKLVKCAVDTLTVKKPSSWDGTWRIVSYDIPASSNRIRKIFREYLHAWRFYPLQESVFLHAYPCETEIEWLRSYLGIEPHVRIFKVSKIEHDKPYREFFGIP